MPRKLTTMALLAGLCLSGAVQATLINRGGGLIYDDVLNITWLQDVTYAKTSGYDADGWMNWEDAKTWAANLSYGGYADWRLPTTNPIGASFNYNTSFDGTTDVGYGNTSTHSELAYMFYVNLHNLALYAPNSADPGGPFFQSGYGLVNTGPFINFSSGQYWSGTEFQSLPVGSSWIFDTYDGKQTSGQKWITLAAWAVRDGDVGAVSEPGTLLLVIIGLAGLVPRGLRRFLGLFNR